MRMSQDAGTASRDRIWTKAFVIKNHLALVLDALRADSLLSICVEEHLPQVYNHIERYISDRMREMRRCTKMLRSLDK